ncbi:hypothetical protein JVT61DRAFT_14400 [Boletus reticuloceps]|uniref:Uncharacterized protein n=1 Tax=Boletus reticuloceps TaxID=495285 RepID=A0A8I2YRC5_9AGAM|nr:hypothetical protein JVT61DRAFT_14400 [Boletus reticuloceps]
MPQTIPHRFLFTVSHSSHADPLPAIPDITFVPQKFHDFILPSVRKIYMDIPSATGVKSEVNFLTQCVKALVKENDDLRHKCAYYQDALKTTESDIDLIL